MSWRTEWKAISDRIEGTLEAGRFYIQCISSNSEDPGDIADRVLIPAAKEIRTSITCFHKHYHALLPASAASCLDRFLKDAPKFFEEKSLQKRFGVQATLTALSAFRAEFAYQITDVSALARRLSERAFSHLNRSIAVDADIQAKWQEAFDHHETKCEKLGAIHLLQHGIWAFKVSGPGAVTDLVFEDRMTDTALAEAERAAEALVLTEWKLVRNPDQLDDEIAKARKQASLYTEELLGGLELPGYRYLVLVSKGRLGMPPDDRDDKITYRHINIVLEPKSVSQEAKKR